MGYGFFYHHSWEYWIGIPRGSMSGRGRGRANPKSPLVLVKTISFNSPELQKVYVWLKAYLLQIINLYFSLTIVIKL